jgi:hypothetical protein
MGAGKKEQNGVWCINYLKTEFPLCNIYKFSSSSQETHYVSATKPNRLILFGETVAVYCENHTEHTDTLCGQNAEFWYVNSVRTSQETNYVTTTEPTG